MRGGNNIKFSFLATTSSNCAYVDSVVSCNECIASIGLKHKEFSILNKQYSKEEYFAIKNELEKRGELSIFPGHEFSTFAYNESASQTQYPLTKEQTLALGYRWQDETIPTRGLETVQPDNIPDNIKDVGEESLKQIYKCVTCSRNYRIIQRELEMYRQFNLPLTRECPQCRQLRRRQQRTPYQTWHRTCMCANGHAHRTNPCNNEFESPYALSGTEIIYCETCYQSEIA
jgi:hypothetical protein